MFEEIMKVESYHLRLPRSVLSPDDVPLFTFSETLWCGWGKKASAGSMDAESSLPPGPCDFAVTVWSCVKQIMLYKHLFKLIEKLFCVGH